MVFISHSRPLRDICHPLRHWPSCSYFHLQWNIQYQPMEVATSDHVTKLGRLFFYLLLELCKAVHRPVFGLLNLFCFLSTICFIIFLYAHISNDCKFVIFLVVIVHVSHPYKRVDHTYAFIILFLVFILMYRAVLVVNIELNAPLAISIMFTMSSSHFPFDVIVCPK